MTEDATTTKPAAGRQPPPGLSSRAIAVAAVLGVLLAVGIVVAGQLLGGTGDTPAQSPAPAPRTGPLGLVPVDSPDASSASCSALVGALPQALPNNGGELDRLPLADPAPAGAAAWGDRVGEPLVLRCGLAKPPELTPTSQLRVVSGVQWLPIEGPGAATWFAVDRPVFVALTLPDGLGTGPLQKVSEVVGQALPAQPVRP
ncbi:DUF3515 domain-containing protein [Actinokineospora sp. G85]|uniref:DUF3515 domain-containing protein n=1 Tax=Actinokineospora sp. G85 TaxID=3406626 RepID=UPI003C740328